MGTADPDPVDPLNRGKVRNGARLCENAQEPTTRRIIFSITLLPIAATAPFVFRLTKSGRIFYAKIKRLRFHTASVVTSL